MTPLKETLDALGRCERESEELARQAQQLPGEIEAAEARAQACRDQVAAEEERLEQAERERRDKEAALQDCEARRTKYQGQTAMVKTNEEYTALLAEIDGMTRRISELEEEILLAMETGDEIRSALGVLREQKRREEQEHQKHAETLRQRLDTVRSDIENHEKQRENLIEELTPEARVFYDRGRRRFRQATSRITGRACVGCHRDIPIETINRVVAGDLHACPHCQRLLLPPEP